MCNVNDNTNRFFCGVYFTPIAASFTVCLVLPVRRRTQHFVAVSISRSKRMSFHFVGRVFHIDKTANDRKTGKLQQWTRKKTGECSTRCGCSKQYYLFGRYSLRWFAKMILVCHSTQRYGAKFICHLHFCGGWVLVCVRVCVCALMLDSHLIQ